MQRRCNCSARALLVNVYIRVPVTALAKQQHSIANSLQCSMSLLDWVYSKRSEPSRLLSVSDEISSSQVVWMVAVAIETGYRTGNPFRVGRSSFNVVTFAHLAPNGKELATPQNQEDE
ncbi:hypothetical protein AVEN_146255-1 [Araneus ventricosus]|uniref:Uncharacterized protein n=1 Tax=Araneus ventricosus TaxID=182803 RepID=A0A4Y2GDC8_ARAVE|nr:hypothetical protein AVEN_146255-1 [Araneus ventricosus]